MRLSIKWSLCIIFSLAVLGFLGFQERQIYKISHSCLYFGFSSFNTKMVKPIPSVTNADLEQLFDKYNKAYFGGELKRIPVVFDSFDDDRLAQFNPGVQKIQVVKQPDGDNAEDVYRFTILHEMAHEWDFQHWPIQFEKDCNSSNNGHGLHWEQTMRWLASEGAFDRELFSGAPTAPMNNP